VIDYLRRLRMINPRCKCSMSISLTGDGCRYCQPQEHIDRIKGHLDEMDKMWSTIVEVWDNDGTDEDKLDDYEAIIYKHEWGFRTCLTT